MLLRAALLPRPASRIPSSSVALVSSSSQAAKSLPGRGSCHGETARTGACGDSPPVGGDRVARRRRRTPSAASSRASDGTSSTDDLPARSCRRSAGRARRPGIAAGGDAAGAWAARVAAVVDLAALEERQRGPRRGPTADVDRPAVSAARSSTVLHPLQQLLAARDDRAPWLIGTRNAPGSIATCARATSLPSSFLRPARP